VSHKKGYYCEYTNKVCWRKKKSVTHDDKQENFFVGEKQSQGNSHSANLSKGKKENVNVKVWVKLAKRKKKKLRGRKE
jgi:hypothetical protein